MGIGAPSRRRRPCDRDAGTAGLRLPLQWAEHGAPARPPRFGASEGHVAAQRLSVSANRILAGQSDVELWRIRGQRLAVQHRLRSATTGPSGPRRCSWRPGLPRLPSWPSAWPLRHQCGGAGATWRSSRSWVSSNASWPPQWHGMPPSPPSLASSIGSRWGSCSGGGCGPCFQKRSELFLPPRSRCGRCGRLGRRPGAGKCRRLVARAPGLPDRGRAPRSPRSKQAGAGSGDHRRAGRSPLQDVVEARS